MLSITKDPNSLLDYTVAWKDWLNLGDAISSVTWLLPDMSGDSAPLVKSAQSKTSDRAVIWLSGGTIGKSYGLICRVTTSGGRTEDYSFIVVCSQH